jgi:putative aminopeptidase FrvX
MTESLYHHLKALTELSAPVGRELLVQQYMETQFSRHTDSLTYDRVGNLQAHFPGEGPRTIIAAHACEVGFIVKNVTDNGYLQIAPNYKTRAPDTRILPFHEVTLFTDTYQSIDGVLTMDTGHVVDKESREKVPSLDAILVDIGANSKEEVYSSGIHVGCPLTWKSQTRKFNSRIKGKSMDDRLGLAVLIQLAAFLSETSVHRDIFLASTVQEEIGVQGARALASQQTFEEAYILEIIPTSQKDPALTLGQGPAIVYKDGSMHYHHPTIVKLREIAKNSTIPLQPAILERGITDGLGFFVNSASRTVLLGCPTLYPHSPGETINITDLNNLQHLMENILL